MLKNGAGNVNQISEKHGKKPQIGVLFRRAAIRFPDPPTL
jgi:hypothetical protein